MKNVCLAQWYNVNNRSKCGYYLEGVQSEKVYFDGKTKAECEKHASENGLKICYEC